MVQNYVLVKECGGETQKMITYKNVPEFEL